MTIAKRNSEWLFYAGWIILGAISLPIAFGVSGIIISLVEMGIGDTIQVEGRTRITEDFLFDYIFWPIVGLVTGFLQYLLLRRYFQQISMWIVATTFGWFLAIFGGMFLSRWSVIGTMILVGGIIGLAQWLVLRRHVERAIWWIPANLLGWGLVGLIIGGPLTGLLGLIIFGTMPAIATSVVLWLLLTWNANGE